MLISPKYKFIYIKTQKTASSSIEKILLDNILDDQNIIFSGMPSHNMSSININNKKLAIKSIHAGNKFISKHWPNEWKTYFKFTSERNPWDKTVSLYYWILHRNPKDKRISLGFDKFVTENLTYLPDWESYTDNDNPIVDFVVQYDSITEDLERLSEILRFPYNKKINSVNLKGDFRPDKDYKKMYTTNGQRQVYKTYIKPINYFKYSF
jgi:hypothetical protein